MATGAPIPAAYTAAILPGAYVNPSPPPPPSPSPRAPVSRSAYHYDRVSGLAKLDLVFQMGGVASALMALTAPSSAFKCCSFELSTPYVV